MTRSPATVLITALQYRDEFHSLKAAMPGPFANLRRQQPLLSVEHIAASTSRTLAEQVWALTADQSLNVGDLFAKLAVCELKIYRAVSELVRTGHLALSVAELSQKVA